MKNQKNKTENIFEEYEKALCEKGFSFVCGVDEVGRGPWAGPIMAAAIMVKSEKLKVKNLGIADSKKLTEKKREEIFDILVSGDDIVYSVASISAKEIDKIGLGVANQLVLKKAVEGLKLKIKELDFVLVDGFEIKDISISQEKVIKGDQKVFSIAIASIIAKVTRDRYMIELSKEFPQYGFEDHKGYGTKKHQMAIEEYGLCPEHRLSFEPIKKFNGQKQK